MSMTMDERKICAEKWSEACKRNEQSLMIQVGGAALPDVLEMVLIFIHISFCILHYSK